MAHLGLTGKEWNRRGPKFLSWFTVPPPDFCLVRKVQSRTCRRDRAARLEKGRTPARVHAAICSGWQPGTRLDSWIYRTTRNLWIDTARAANRRGETFVAAEQGDTIGDAGDRAIPVQRRGPPVLPGGGEPSVAHLSRFQDSTRFLVNLPSRRIAETTTSQKHQVAIKDPGRKTSSTPIL